MQGEKPFESGAYTGVREHFERLFNAAARRQGRFRQPARVLAAALLALAASGPKLVSAVEPPDLAWIDFALIDAGEILVQTGREDRGVVTVEVATRIRAPKKIIFDILRECEIAPEFVPNVLACRLIEAVDDGNSELFVQTVKPAFFVPRFEHVFRLDYFPYERIEVHRVSGPIAEMDGAWWLLDDMHEEGAVLLVHTLRLRPGIPVPRIFVRATLRRDLPIVFQAVRARAETLAAN